MNEFFTTHNTAAAEAARRIKSAGMETIGTFSAHQPHINALSSTDIAQRVMRLTGNVRLARRSGLQWHHCGLNE